jgi:hypothetical protein
MGYFSLLIYLSLDGILAAETAAGALALHLGGHIEDFRDLLQNALALLFVIPLNGSNDAGIQVIFQYPGADFIQRGFHSLDLADDVDTVGVFLHHTDDATQVAFNGF